MAAQEELPDDKDLKAGDEQEEGPEPDPQTAVRPRSLPADPGSFPPTDRPSIVHAQLDFSGPLPPPQILGQYDEVLPGAAERILRMAEKQQDHRIGMDQSSVRRANWGLGAGYSLSLIGLFSTTFLVMHGHDMAGSVLGGSTFLSLVSTFVYGSIVRSRENIEKTRLLTGQDQEEAEELPWSATSPKRAKKRKQ